MKHIFCISLLIFVMGSHTLTAQQPDQTEGFLIMFEPDVKADDVRSKACFPVMVS